MKFVLKNIVFLIVFSFIFSALTGCTRIETAAVDSNSGATPAPDAPAEKSKSNYPPAPSVIMQNQIKMLDGTTFKLEEKKGKVVLVNLWATWCGPCRNEMPHLNEMQEKFRDKGFEILGLDIDNESKEDIDAFAAKAKLNYQLGYADNRLMYEFVKLSKLDGIPQSIIIDREGRLNGVFAGGSPKVINQMKETVNRLMSE